MMNAWIAKRTKIWLYSNLRNIAGKDAGDIFLMKNVGTGRGGAG